MKRAQNCPSQGRRISGQMGASTCILQGTSFFQDTSDAQMASMQEYWACALLLSTVEGDFDSQCLTTSNKGSM